MTTVTYMDTIVEKGNCKASNTLKNGKQTCENEKIFEEPFNNLKSCVWKHTIKMSPEPVISDVFTYTFILFNIFNFFNWHFLHYL